MPEDMGPIEGAGVTPTTKVGNPLGASQAAVIDHPSGFPDAATITTTTIPGTYPTSITNGQPELRFSAADIEKARKEEKDKLYSRLSSFEEKSKTLEDELKILRDERESRIKSEEEAKARADELEKKKTEDDMSVRDLLAKKEQEWMAQFNKIEEEKAAEQTLREKERQFFELQQYRQKRLDETANEIAPQLRDLISGETPEQVEQSITLMAQKTAQIMEEITQAQSAMGSLRGVSPTSGYALDGTPPGSAPGNLSVADLKNMSMSQYAKIRDQLMSQQRGGRGLFG